MNSKFLVGVVVLALGVGVGWYVLQSKNTSKVGLPTNVGTDQVTNPTVEPFTTSATVQTNTQTSGTEKGGVPSGQTGAAISYTDSGFSPKNITVKKGATVTFSNSSSKAMWVASDVHPTHQLLPGFDELKSVQNGGIYEYQFTKVGTWTFHNHVNPSDKGIVIVVQ